MTNSPPTVRTVTELDHARLDRLVRRQPGSQGDDIADVIDSADLVASQDIPADVVTMNSQVLVAEVPGGEERKLTLCYPADVDPVAGFISVLSPVGSSLLGQSVGAVANWTAPDGTLMSNTVLAILSQPGAPGDKPL
ncbi:MAG: regulator of nucleoside diphosphate kinase [Rhodoferax sp.]|jgi:regulator of nucleoside diphosphate kinase